MTDTSEGIGWKTHWEIHKFRDEDGEIDRMIRAGVKPSTLESHERFIGKDEIVGNIAVDDGLTLCAALIAGTSSAHFGSGAYIAVGTSTQAAAAGDQALVAQSARVQVTSATPGTKSIVYIASFDGSTANVAWNEYGVFNSSSGATMLNRKVASKGTKESGETWTLQVTINFTSS